MPEYYIGLMSGTSIDGVDAALVDFTDTPKLVCFAYQPFSDKMRQAISHICEDSFITLKDYGKLDCQLGELYAHSVQTLLEQSGITASEIKAIGNHGQTVLHAPDTKHPFSLQLGDPNIIAEKTGITTIADFRRKDIAAGGQGAPLVPGFHKDFFHNNTENRVVVNIGGVANITVLPAQDDADIIGFDTGPGNTLLDQWIYSNLQANFDKNGEWAKSGKIQPELVEHFKQDPYFERPSPKSTGKKYFSPVWLKKQLTNFGRQFAAEDIQASLCQLTAESISDAIKLYAATTERVLLCGGGFHNEFLFSRLQQLLDCPVVSTNEYGIHPDHVEAMAFAWLAKQTIEGKAGSLTDVTGARAPTILGGIYTGRYGLDRE